MSRYMQYSMAASQEAVENAGWFPGNEAEKRMTVRPLFPSSDKASSSCNYRESRWALASAAWKKSTIPPLLTRKA